jgi:hypothetical protein
MSAAPSSTAKPRRPRAEFKPASAEVRLRGRGRKLAPARPSLPAVAASDEPEDRNGQAHHGPFPGDRAG